jgi:uncharacterized BrkB/YihY/UPF0761 family membrane protein
MRRTAVTIKTKPISPTAHALQKAATVANGGTSENLVVHGARSQARSMHLRLLLASTGLTWMLVALWFVLPRFTPGKPKELAIGAFLVSVGLLLVAALLA